MQNPHTIQHGNFALYNHLLKMEKSICNFHQRNTSNIRFILSKPFSCPRIRCLVRNLFCSGCHCFSFDFPLSFKYIFLTCFCPADYASVAHKNILSFLYRANRAFEPHFKDIPSLPYCGNTSSLYCCPEKQASGL